MDRNTIIGIILIAVILISSTFLFQQNEEDKKEATHTETVVTEKADEEAVVADTTAKVVVQDTSQGVAASKLSGPWAGLDQGEEQIVTLENSELLVKISSKGGRIIYTQLKDYNAYGGGPLTLTTEGSNNYSYGIPVGGDIINTEDLYFAPTEVSSRSVVMTANLSNGKAVKLSYALPKKGYMTNHSLSLLGLNDLIPRRIQYIDLYWHANTLQQEKDSTIAANNTTIHYRDMDGETDYLSETEDERETIKTELQWVSFKQQFFAQSLITKTPFIVSDLSTQFLEGENYTKSLEARLTLPYSHEQNQVYEMDLYMGPLKYNTLEDFELDLERQIPLGWSFFLIQWVNTGIVIPIFNLLNNTIASYGLIILILTIFIKLIVMPFTYKSYLSMAKMRVLKPDLDELRAKYGEDMARMQSEQMKLYKKAGVSPFGGCLPLLLQFPILVAMFRFFPASIELRQEAFLWADDLSSYDNILPLFGIDRLPFKIPYYGDHVSLFTLLMTVSTIIYSKINSSMSAQQNEFKWIMYIMPIFFLGFFNNYAAGLSLYYFYFNILTFIQQYFFKKFINEDKLKHKIEENKKRPVSAKKSKFQQRLEDMAKQQQQARSRKR